MTAKEIRTRVGDGLRTLGWRRDKEGSYRMANYRFRLTDRSLVFEQLRDKQWVTRYTSMWRQVRFSQIESIAGHLAYLKEQGVCTGDAPLFISE